HADLRVRASAAGQHPRTPGIIADLALGWEYFLRFALEAGAVDEAEHRRLWDEVWAALLQAGAEQGEEIAAQDPARRFLELLAAAVPSGRAHLAGPDGHAPQDPHVWGWQPHAWTSPGGDAHSEMRRKGDLVGWVTPEGVFLDAEAAYASAQRLGEE